jgi:transposase
MTDPTPGIYGGVDTHKDLNVAAVVNEMGRILDVASFPTSAAGHRRLLGWMRSHGEVIRVGIEGTGSYGAGLTRHLLGEEVEVVEVNRPNRQARRRRGKSDTADAEAAARAALSGDAGGRPKSADGIVESIRAIRVAFCSTRATRTRLANQIKDLVLCAPDELRAALEPLDTNGRVERCARFRPGPTHQPAEATKLALRTLARQHQALTKDLEDLRQQLDTLTMTANPALRASSGVGADVASILLVATGDNPERLTGEAAFAALCGTSPVDASSGKIVRHRLNQGGNRQANHALWRIVMVRMTCDQRTKRYIARRTAEGKTRREIIRCLKRYVAREIHALLIHPDRVPAAHGADLRQQRITAGLTQHDVAAALGVQQPQISRIENDHPGYRDLATRYRSWLTAHTTTCAA